MCFYSLFIGYLGWRQKLAVLIAQGCHHVLCCLVGLVPGAQNTSFGILTYHIIECQGLSWMHVAITKVLLLQQSLDRL